MRLLILATLLASCASKHRAARRDGATYQIDQDPGAGWQPVKSGGADHAWYNPTLAATIYTDASCAERFEDGKLTDLAAHQGFGFAQGGTVTEQALRLGGRDALRRTWDARLDGVTVRVGSVVTKKNTCIYDIVYIAPPSRFDQGEAAFQRVVDGLHTVTP